MQILKQATAATVIVGPVLDEDGLAVTSAVRADFRLTKNGTVSSLNASATVTHNHNGHYLIALTTTDTNTLGRLVVTCANTAMAMRASDLEVLAGATFDALVTNAAGTANGLPTISATGELFINQKLSDFLATSLGTDTKVLISTDGQDLSRSLLTKAWLSDNPVFALVAIPDATAKAVLFAGFAPEEIPEEFEILLTPHGFYGKRVQYLDFMGLDWWWELQLRASQLLGSTTWCLTDANPNANDQWTHTDSDPCGVYTSANLGTITITPIRFACDAANLPAKYPATIDWAADVRNAPAVPSKEQIATQVEAQVISETDGNLVLKAITDKIAAVNPSLSGLTLAAIASALRTALAVELARIDTAISSRLASAEYSPPPADYQQRNVPVTLPTGVASETSVQAVGAAVVDVGEAVGNMAGVGAGDAEAIAAAVWSNPERSLSRPTATAVGPTASRATADIFATCFRGGSVPLRARVTLGSGNDAKPADITAIHYSIYELGEDDPDVWSPVAGHQDVDLSPADVLYDALQSDLAAAGYNFAHEPSVTEHAAFTNVGATYAVVYSLAPVVGQPFIVRFKVRVI